MYNALIIVEYLLIGLLGAFIGSIAGLGGGSIIIPILYFIGLDPRIIISSSKTLVFANSLISTFRYTRRIKIPYRLYLSIVIPMSISSFIGAYLVVLIPPRYLSLILGTVLFIASLKLVIQNKEGEKKISIKTQYHVGIITGAIAGLIAGLTGIGGGIIYVPVFLHVLKLEPRLVVALSMACILPSASSSLIRHLIDGIIDPVVVFPLSIGALIGGWIGSHIALSISQKRLRKIIGVIIAVATFRIIIQSLLG